MPDEVREYGTVVLAKGTAKITAHILAGTKLDIIHAAAGDGGGAYYRPTTDQENLVNELWRGEIASAEINADVPNMIDVKIVIPDDVGGFMIRELSIIDSDGDTFAICNTPDTEKVPINRGVSGKLTMVMHILVADASVLRFHVNPALNTVSKEELERALERHNSDPDAHLNLRSATLAAITIPATGWQASGEEDYPYRLDVPCEASTADSIPCVALDRASQKTASAAGLCPTVQALEGALRFLTEKEPAADMTATAALYDPGSFVAQLDVTIPGNGWGDSDGEEPYPLSLEVPCECVKAAYTPMMVLDRASLRVAGAAGLCPTVEAADGLLRFHAQAVPAAAITGTVYLMHNAFGAWDDDLTDGEKRDPEVLYEKSRPIDWMRLPGLEEVGEGELWLLFQWPKGSTHRCQFSVRSAAGGSVEAGRYADGVFTPNEGYTQEYGANATVALTLDSADFGDVTSRGDVQAMVRFSGDLTSFTANTDKTGCVDGVVNAPNMTTLSFAKPDDLTYFAFAGISAQAASIGFRYSYFLRAIRGTAQGLNAVANGSYLFGECYSLQALPPDLTLAGLVTGTYAFQSCHSLTALPSRVTLAALVTGTGMFTNCYTLTALPAGVTLEALVTGTSMFSGCHSIRALPDGVTLAALTTGTSMFADCYSLTDLPANAAFPALTNGAGMFRGTKRVGVVGALNSPNVTTLDSFIRDSAIRAVGPLDIPVCSNLTNAFASCPRLEELTFGAGMKSWDTPVDLVLSGCNFSRAGIVKLFQSLPTITIGKTITLTGNPGISDLTEDDRAIATGKGWAVIPEAPAKLLLESAGLYPAVNADILEGPPDVEDGAAPEDLTS